MLVQLDDTIYKHSDDYERKCQDSIHLQVIICAELKIGRLYFANVAQLKEVLLRSVYCPIVSHCCIENIRKRMMQA